MRMLEQQEDELGEGGDVTWEDQSSINAFSKLNVKLQTIQEQLRSQHEEKEDLDDLGTELELIVDEDERLGYKVGDAFVMMTVEEINSRLQNDMQCKDLRIQKLVEEADSVREQMEALKKLLYARFGRSINLEN